MLPSPTVTCTAVSKPFREYSLPSWRRLLGVVPQQLKIFNTSLLENIILGRPDNLDANAFEAFWKDYGFEEYFRQLPGGLGTILGETGINLSGGQQQMVALARALYQQPQLLLLDEATAAMDRKTEQRILNLISGLKDKMGIVLVTHRIKTAALADRIYLIEEGRISQSGTHDELMESKNFYSEAVEEMRSL